MTQKLAVGLTIVNLSLLAVLLAQLGPAHAQSTPGLLRGTGLEIVDAQGRPRATISVAPANPNVKGVDGHPFPETVILRLIDPKYGPVVKLGGSERTAGLGLGGDSLAKWTLLEATSAGSSLKLTAANGTEKLITP